MGAGENQHMSPSVTAESPVHSSKAANQAAFKAMLKTRQLLMQELIQIKKDGGGSQQVAAWQQKNADRLEELQVQSVALAAARPPSRMPEITQINLPKDTSETRREFMKERVRLFNDRARVHNETLQATPAERRAAMEEWAKLNATALAQQAARARTMREERPVAGMPRLPDSPMIPERASPELTDFLTKRHTMMKEKMEMTSSLQTVTPEQQRQAMEQWYIKNASRIEAMQTAALRLSSTRQPPY